MSNDLPNGAGRAVYSNGTTYQGDWKVKTVCNTYQHAKYTSINR
jgi:hypothetical protein